MKDVYVVLSLPDEHWAPVADVTPPTAIVRASITASESGPSSLFLRPGDLVARTLWTHQAGAWRESGELGFSLDLQFATPALQGARRETQLQLAKLSGLGACARELEPLQIIVVDQGKSTLYHLADTGPKGTLYLSYDVLPELVVSPLQISDMLQRTRASLDRSRASLNDGCWYTKWNATMEIERKFTFPGIPDTWDLTVELYRRICAGRLEGFFPELGKDFQVFDYEAHMFEVVSPEAEAGYISYIPQVDGLVTVKRKWFVKNAEVRRETLWPNQKVDVAERHRHAKELCNGSVVERPTYRRKRFDVNFESAQTGNVFGVYFDICRTTDGSSSFSQCEVEYCRSRVLGPVHSVMDEFERVSAFTEDYLRSRSVAYERNLYSKLDFVRDAAAAAARKVV